MTEPLYLACSYDDCKPIGIFTFNGLIEKFKVIRYENRSLSQEDLKDDEFIAADVLCVEDFDFEQSCFDFFGSDTFDTDTEKMEELFGSEEESHNYIKGIFLIKVKVNNAFPTA